MLDLQEHKELRWFTVEKLESIPLDISVRYYAKEALRRVSLIINKPSRVHLDGYKS